MLILSKCEKCGMNYNYRSTDDSEVNALASNKHVCEKDAEEEVLDTLKRGHFRSIGEEIGKERVSMFPYYTDENGNEKLLVVECDISFSTLWDIFSQKTGWELKIYKKKNGLHVLMASREVGEPKFNKNWYEDLLPEYSIPRETIRLAVLSGPLNGVEVFEASPGVEVDVKLTTLGRIVPGKHEMLL